jgi:hypothetical protein
LENTEGVQMETSSNANVIVERMLVNYLSTKEEERVDLLGAEQSARAWELVRLKLVKQDMASIANDFEQQPKQLESRIISAVEKFMKIDSQLARELQQLYNEFLQTGARSRARLERARDKLVSQYIYHPDVTLIDIGFPLEDNRETKESVLRIHVKDRWMKSSSVQRTAFPKEVDGIPVIVILGDYKLE